MFAPPAFRVCMSAAVSVVTCRQAASRTPLNGFSLAKRSRIRFSTGMLWAAHSIRSLPVIGKFDILHIVFHQQKPSSFMYS